MLPGFRAGQDPLWRRKDDVAETALICADIGDALVYAARGLGDAFEIVDARAVRAIDHGDFEGLPDDLLAFLLNGGDIAGFLQGVDDIVGEFRVRDGHDRLARVGTVLETGDEIGDWVGNHGN